MTEEGERRPWWYSGDDSDGAEGTGAEPEPVDGLVEETVEGPDHGTDDTDGEAAPGMDWTLLVAGAQRMVDWATERVMAPHAEHGDPAEHPQCVVCRTLVLVGDSSGMAPTDPDEGVEETGGEPEPIAWIPIREDAERSSIGD